MTSDTRAVRRKMSPEVLGDAVGDLAGVVVRRLRR